MTLRKINLKGTDFEIEIGPFRFLGFSGMRETEMRRRMRGKQIELKVSTFGNKKEKSVIDGEDD